MIRRYCISQHPTTPEAAREVFCASRMKHTVKMSLLLLFIAQASVFLPRYASEMRQNHLSTARDQRRTPRDPRPFHDRCSSSRGGR